MRISQAKYSQVFVIGGQLGGLAPQLPIQTWIPLPRLKMLTFVV